MTAHELWNAYQAQIANTTEGDNSVTDTASSESVDKIDSACADSASALPYTAWAFGGLTAEDTNTLANLVRNGAKTATAGAYDAYLAEGSALPQIDEYNIILDTNDNAVCITKTTAVTTLPFCEVSAAHAKKEELGQRKMYCCHAVENIASQKVVEKLGFAYAGMDTYQSFDGTRQFESKYYFLAL